ncbi:hypothetical protein RRG08_014624 [Elysia crispata]|uniref:Secreted protein n=1 Tax=Elysia crispata TaxID=231223 RepID=A0AAE0YSB0_9GAST|nr:hypothetical protein RRG08_014624 [Elysia crispata]
MLWLYVLDVAVQLFGLSSPHHTGPVLNLVFNPWRVYHSHEHQTGPVRAGDRQQTTDSRKQTADSRQTGVAKSARTKEPLVLVISVAFNTSSRTSSNKGNLQAEIILAPMSASLCSIYSTSDCLPLVDVLTQSAEISSPVEPSGGRSSSHQAQVGHVAASRV